MAQDEQGQHPLTPQPLTPEEGATASDVGARKPGDTDDIGGTDAMRAETGGLAGTSR
ncbi:hypothetical protein [Sphingomonas sp. GM_Shp_2]|uniref:hypothetical protein n=1 Tax=Sphingomonas sp. GM_Shp_2 TaxID=2937380 RepID=UPI00226A49F5|nr:hypothetical protein [Sphingomonas sp. GM_Shp_2]